MGVYHLAPVGTSPGAVTSALAYLKHNEKLPEFDVRGDLVQTVVLFPSWEVWERGTTEKECVLNDYGRTMQSRPKSWPSGYGVLEVIGDFVEAEFSDKVEVHCCPLNAEEYDDCFETIAKAALRFGAEKGNTGKHLWANLTGGPNVVNAALFQVAYWSGLVARLYYTFLSSVDAYGQYLRPPSTSSNIFGWREVPLVKTRFDAGYYQIVEVLAELDDWCEDVDLLSLLKGEGMLPNMKIEEFRPNILNKMDGREIEREVLPDDGKTPEDERRTNRIRISPYGRQVLEQVSSPLFKALLDPDKRDKEEIAALTSGLECLHLR